MPTYKTKDGQDYLLPGVGHTVDGKITTDQKIENPKFELVVEAPAAPPAAPAPTQAPAPPAQQTPQTKETN